MVQLGVRQIQMCLSKFCRSSAGAHSHGRENRVSRSNWQNERDHYSPTPRRTRRWSKRAWAIGLNQRGFSTLGGCLALLAAIAGVGLYRVVTRIQNLAHSQVALDRCSGSFILHLRAASIAMENSYLRVETYRAAAAAACAPVVTCPEALELLQVALIAEAGIERVIQVYWSEQNRIWDFELSNRCDISFWVKKSPFPDFPYSIIDPAEGLAVNEGTRSLFTHSEDLVLSLKEFNLSSKAKATQESLSNWSVRWIE